MSVRDTSGVLPIGRASFETTRWSIVAAAGDARSPRAAEALEVLCRAYWYPLYAYVRRRGLTVPDAQDITQEFFQRLISKNYLETVDRGKGSFRAFLLTSMSHLLSNEWEKARTLKRGGGNQVLSLDVADAEGRFLHEPAGENESAEKTFDRRWALTVLGRALARLREQWASAGKLTQFELLKPYLSDVAETNDYSALAQKLHLLPTTVAVVVHRIRQRYQRLVQAEIALTVTNEEELKAEMHHLLASLE